MKRFRIPPEAIRPLAVGFGACLASDRVTVEGVPVGLMFREEPDGPADSGWRFAAGTETGAWVDDPGSTSVCDVNTIANCDPDIVPFLAAPVGATFVRWPPGGPLRPDAPAPPPPSPVRVAVGGGWSLELEPSFTRADADDAVRFVAPGPPFRAVWVDVWAPPPGTGAAENADVLEQVRRIRRPSSAEVFDEVGPDGPRFASWYPERVDGEDRWSLHGYAFAGGEHVQAAFVATEPDQAWALAAWGSLRRE